MTIEETLVKLEELRKSSNSEPLKHKIIKIQDAYLDRMIENDGLKVE
ncbi:MAG: hypothetical protein K5785_08385 [Nitrosarchaeum sp.]|nr:hypothetical protein [Nitrosarchaeum sp.]